jgi:cysteinyl-tRNA synthetase
VHEAVRRGNTALAEVDDAGLRSALGDVRAMLDTLGLDPLSPQWAGPEAGGDDRAKAALGALLEGQLARREAARAARDYAAADSIRDALAGAGIAIEDGPDGPRWSFA